MRRSPSRCQAVSLRAACRRVSAPTTLHCTHSAGFHAETSLGGPSVLSLPAQEGPCRTASASRLSSPVRTPPAGTEDASLASPLMPLRSDLCPDSFTPEVQFQTRYDSS